MTGYWLKLTLLMAYVIYVIAKYIKVEKNACAKSTNSSFCDKNLIVGYIKEVHKS